MASELLTKVVDPARFVQHLLPNLSIRTVDPIFQLCPCCVCEGQYGQVLGSVWHAAAEGSGQRRCFKLLHFEAVDWWFVSIVAVGEHQGGPSGGTVSCKLVTFWCTQRSIQTSKHDLVRCLHTFSTLNPCQSHLQRARQVPGCCCTLFSLLAMVCGVSKRVEA